MDHFYYVPQTTYLQSSIYFHKTLYQSNFNYFFQFDPICEIYIPTDKFALNDLLYHKSRCHLDLIAFMPSCLYYNNLHLTMF